MYKNAVLVGVVAATPPEAKIELSPATTFGADLSDTFTTWRPSPLAAT
jgi:hypothetical protein